MILAIPARDFVGRSTAWRVAVRWGWVVAIFDVVAVLFILAFVGLLPMTYASEAPRANLTEPVLPEGALDHYYRDHLDERGQALYDIVENAYRTMVHVVDVPDGTTAEELENAAAAVQADNPDIFWVDTSYDYQVEIWGVSSFTIRYLIDDPDQVAQLAAAYDNHARGIINYVEAYQHSVAGNWGEPISDYEMAQGFYRWIAIHTEYEALDARDQHMAAVFDEHKGVCAGYSKTMKYLCDRAGIPCLYIAGGAWAEIEASSSGNHAWNVMELDGKTVYVDVTWGDDGSSVDWSWFGRDWSSFRFDHRSRNGEYFDRPEWPDGTRVEDTPLGTEDIGEVIDFEPGWAHITIEGLAEAYENASEGTSEDDDSWFDDDIDTDLMIGGKLADAAGVVASRAGERT